MTEPVADKQHSNIPNGISELNIQNALAKAQQCNELSLTSCVIEHINQDGENFCSDIYRVNVKYTKTPEKDAKQVEEQLILKILLPGVADFGSNEILMYEKVLPEMDKLFNKANKLTQLKLSPKCYYVNSTDTEIYLMENLNALGYFSADRCKGADLQHARVLLQKLARFHAAGMVLLKQQPELLAKLGPSHYAKCSEDPISLALTKGATAYVANLISNWPGYETIAEKMQRQLPYYSKIIQEVVLPENSKFNVLTHGDLWLNNALFSYAADKPSDVIFVDFQIGFVGTPAVDLNFFFYTSLQLEVLQTEHDALLAFYYEKLQESLEHLDHSDLLPTYDLFLQEMKRSEFYAYYAAVCEMPLCAMDKSTAANFNVQTFCDKQALDKKREQLYANERVVTFLRYVLKEFDALGILDLGVTTN